MYMDFAQALIEERGYGDYVRLPLEHLPLLWLAYLSDPSNSGKIHSDVKARWKQGEREARPALPHHRRRRPTTSRATGVLSAAPSVAPWQVVEAMKEFGSYTDQAREALELKDWKRLGEGMSANFALRRRIYGEPCLGEANLAMIAVAEEAGLPVKFPGSGGAVVGMATSEEEREYATAATAPCPRRTPSPSPHPSPHPCHTACRYIKLQYENSGYVFTKLTPHGPAS